MNFDKLLQIVNESNQVSHQEYTTKLKFAYKVIFDLDDSDFINIEQRELMPPSYCHHYFSSNLEFTYKLKKYKVYHKLFHYKISQYSINDMNKTADSEEWEEFLKNMESFDEQPLTDNLLKNKNIQIKTKISVYELSDQPQSTLSSKFEMEDRKHLASEELHGSIKDVVERVKTIIDGRDDNDQDEQYVDPVVPGGKLIPA